MCVFLSALKSKSDCQAMVQQLKAAHEAGILRAGVFKYSTAGVESGSFAIRHCIEMVDAHARLLK